MMSLAAWHARAQWFDADQGRLFFRRDGAGEPLLLLHGFPTSSWDWQRLWPALTAHFDCLALDKLGYGFSDKPDAADYSVGAHLDRLLALLQAQGWSSVSVLTHDNGNSLVQEWLARQLEAPAALPVRLQRVCFLNGGLFPEQHRARPGQRLLLSPLGAVVARTMPAWLFKRSLAEVFGRQTPPTAADLNSYWLLLQLQAGQRLLHRHIRYIRERRQERARWVGALMHTDVPFCLIDGVQDPVSGGHMVSHFRELLPGRVAVELDCGHFPHLEMPAQVLAALREQWHF